MAIYYDRCLLPLRCIYNRLRVGRLGAPWRHVKGVTTNNGVYFSFVDGEIYNYFVPILCKENSKELALYKFAAL